MQFSLKKLCLREEWTLPSFRSMFPVAVNSPSTSDISSIDATMTLGGLPPLSQLNKTTEQYQVKTEAPSTGGDVAGAPPNEIVTAFASLDAEAEGASGSLPLELQCRYRNGKCSQPRTLKKNGSMHGYCEYHRQLSVRNQRVFDQKKRCQQKLEELEKQPRRSHKPAFPEVKKRANRRRSGGLQATAFPSATSKPDTNVTIF